MIKNLTAVITNSLTAIGVTTRNIYKQSTIKHYLLVAQELLGKINSSIKSEAFFHAFELTNQLESHLEWLYYRPFAPKIRYFIQQAIFPLIRCIKLEIINQSSPRLFNSFFIGHNSQIQPWKTDYIRIPLLVGNYIDEPLNSTQLQLIEC
ncbi:MAG: hypothetical protein ACXAC7_12025 [Candidatus Hodarchaeales archaeon]